MPASPGSGGSALGTLYRFELRMLLRDRRALFASVVLPVVVLPFFLFASSIAERGREERQAEATYRYAVTGPAAEAAVELIDGAPADDPDALDLERQESEDPAADLAAGRLDFYLQAFPAVGRGEGPALAGGSPVAGEVDLPRLRIVYRGDRDASDTAADELQRRLEAARQEGRRQALGEAGFPVPMERVAVVESRDVATAEQVTGLTLGRWGTLFVLLFLLTGGSVVAADTLAGEKERGTLETVLTTAVNRTEMVVAKQLVILTVGVVITVVQLANLAVYLGLDLIELPAGFAVDPSPTTLLLLLLLFLPLAALAASLLLLASGYCRSYKEFQLYYLPVFLLLMLPASASLWPGIELRSAVALVPVANLSVAVREVMVGKVDLAMLAVAWVVSALVAALGARVTLGALDTERLITAGDAGRAEHLGGPELFERRVLLWFAGLWVVIFLALANVPFLATSMSVQLLFNLVLVFLGGSLLMIRRYRLEPRRAMALRAPPLAAWPATLLGAPALFLVGTAIARLSGALFPVPEDLAERFAEALVPPAVPLWELLLLVAVLPGICEEIAFRGLLLHGLRRRLHPALLPVVVGVVFGLFHLDLLRLLPTAVLGVALTVVVLLTGSLYPAILWHALNNATAILAVRAGVDLDALPPWLYALAAIVAAASFTVLWRTRRPYPGLRGR